MRRIAIPILVLLTLLLVTMPVFAQDPVRLDLVEAYVVVLNDGRLDVRYTLTFTELQQGRERIQQMGPFPRDHTIVSSSGQGPGGAFTVNLTGGPEYYQVNFEERTRQGEQYQITVRYTVDRSVFDPTQINGEDYRLIVWSPFQWALPIERQEIRYILPVPLPEGVTEAEQVTDAIVDETGLIAQNPEDYDRWVYFATPDEPSGVSYLSIFVAEESLPPETNMQPQFYLPARYITTTAETPIPLKPTPGVPPAGGGVQQPTATPVPTGPLGLTGPALQLTICTGGFVTIAVLVALVLALRKRKPKPTYVRPKSRSKRSRRRGWCPT